jgi:Ca2+-binding RTX toxin-like protein
LKGARKSQISAVLTEEFGHYLDSRFNRTDALGDEGEFFSRILSGEHLAKDKITSIRSQSDALDLILQNGMRINVEAAQITGGNDDDRIIGSDGADMLNGMGGNDFIDGKDGNDNLSGDVGNDTINGGAGNDTINGGADIDTADYSSVNTGVVVNLTTGRSIGDGDDTLISVENIIGGSGADELVGDGNNNTLNGGAGNDILNGGSGNDTLNGDAGNDMLNGGGGNDTLNGGGGTNLLTGGDGIDTADEQGEHNHLTASLLKNFF